jgi:hypothetical protein
VSRSCGRTHGRFLPNGLAAQDGHGDREERRLDQDRAERQEQDFVLCLPIHEAANGLEPWIVPGSLAGARRMILVDAQGYEGTGESHN